MTMGLLKKVVYKAFNILERSVFFIIEHVVIFFIVRTSYKRLPSSVVGHCNVLAGDHFYKMALKNRGFFIEERKNIDLIRDKYPQIGKMIPDYQHLYFLNDHIRVMKAKKLSLIQGRAAEFSAAKKVLDIFQGYGALRTCEAGQFPSLSSGLGRMEQFYGAEISRRARACVEFFLKSGPVRIGPCHGDLHHKNIIGSVEAPYIVDLDCFRDGGLQALDVIYYVNQWIADDENLPWDAALVRLLADKKKYALCHDLLNGFLGPQEVNGYALVYCFDRFEQDAKYLNDWGIFMGARFRGSVLSIMDGQRMGK